MFIDDSGSRSHMVNNLKNMMNVLEFKKMVKIRNKKTMTVLLWGNWKGFQKRDGKIYLVMCTDTAHIPYLRVNIFSLTCALTKGFNMTPENEIPVLKKNTTILEFEELLDHRNGESYLSVTRM